MQLSKLLMPKLKGYRWNLSPAGCLVVQTVSNQLKKNWRQRHLENQGLWMTTVTKHMKLTLVLLMIICYRSQHPRQHPHLQPLSWRQPLLPPRILRLMYTRISVLAFHRICSWCAILSGSRRPDQDSACLSSQSTIPGIGNEGMGRLRLLSWTIWYFPMQFHELQTGTHPLIIFNFSVTYELSYSKFLHITILIHFLCLYTQLKSLCVIVSTCARAICVCARENSVCTWKLCVHVKTLRARDLINVQTAHHTSLVWARFRPESLSNLNTKFYSHIKYVSVAPLINCLVRVVAHPKSRLSVR